MWGKGHGWGYSEGAEDGGTANGKGYTEVAEGGGNAMVGNTVRELGAGVGYTE